jgi:hypothetical protein
MRFVDLSWIVNPALRNPTVLGGLTDVIGVVAIGGLWIGFFLWQLGRRSILPLGEPQLQEALSAHG